MDKNTSTGLSIFHQICEVNDLDPQEIMQEAQQRCPEKLAAGTEAEAYIWMAFEHRAQDLLQRAGAAPATTGNAGTSNALYRIDADPAAPAFVTNEDYIRSNYSQEQARKLVDALELVRLPVTG